jgi:hypothetical protein
MQEEEDEKIITTLSLFLDCSEFNEKAFYKLDDKGELEPINYNESIKNSNILW